ncbi:MAG: alanine--tRNA ligase, partial [Candidatus Harrisonbacteria bacterium]|nr:alanine--tRNA ligase [Candidatus Harrisonbacteria bacterium]
QLDAVKDVGARRVTTAQKSFRTSDIEEAGDRTHLTFFEMLGNFCFQDYWKREAITWAYEFVTEVLGIASERLTVTVFAGDTDVPFDKESYDIWRHVVGLPESRIAKHDRKDNFWGPTGNEGPCGPTTEIYVAPSAAEAMAGKGIEIWNIVFNEFYCRKDKTLEKSKTPGIDTGMGLERLTAMLQGISSVFETDLFRLVMDAVNELAPQLDDRDSRIVADHLRASVFLIADGVRPSNKEAGYILRRLLRRVMALAVKNDAHEDLFPPVLRAVQDKLGSAYPEIMRTKEISEVVNAEREKFSGVIASGVKELARHKTIGAKEAFLIYESFGLPFELIKELAPAEATKGLKREDFDKEFAHHQEISRAGAEKKFGGHGLLLDTGELKAKDEVELQKVVRLHTATHLLQAALREVLGKDVAQKGSDITAERTRFDFSFPRKVTPEELKKVEELVNKKIQEDLPVAFQELPADEAAKTGALHFFNVKYPPKVKVYYTGHSLSDAFSKEFCGGPHVNHCLEIGTLKIIKEEAVSSGVRRIRAVVQP